MAAREAEGNGKRRRRTRSEVIFDALRGTPICGLGALMAKVADRVGPDGAAFDSLHTVAAAVNHYLNASPELQADILLAWYKAPREPVPKCEQTPEVADEILGWAEITPGRLAYVVVRSGRQLRFPDGKSAAWEVDHDAGIIRMNPNVTDREAERDLAFIVEKARETLPPPRASQGRG